MLAHEGSHVAHGDFYVLLLAMLNRAVFWFSPFAWWQLRRLADLAEIISDDAAIEALDDRASYADILLGVASEAQQAPAGIAMARPRTVRRRLERILAATAVSARGMDWRRRALIASTLIPLIAVCAGSIARGTSTAQPTAGSAAQSEPGAGGHTMLSAQRKLAAVDAKLFDDYVGHYQLSRTAIFTVTRSDDQLFAQRTGQRKVPLHPVTTNEYVYGSSATRITFVTDDQGTATALVLHQNGQKWPSVRVDEAKATAIEGVFARQIAAAPDRFRDQTPVHGSKDAVLRTIAELQHAAPNYDRMSRSLADSMRPQMPQLQSMLTALGSVDSIFFRGVGPGGYDIYGVKFANGFAEFRLLMGADGTIEDVVFRPDGDDTPGGIAACSEEQSLKSSAGTTPIRLLLFNGTGADIHLFELDLKGKRPPRVTIGDERSASILTYVGRPWIITDAAGKCLEIVWPGQRTRFLAGAAGSAGRPTGSTDGDAPDSNLRQRGGVASIYRRPGTRRTELRPDDVRSGRRDAAAIAAESGDIGKTRRVARDVFSRRYPAWKRHLHGPFRQRFRRMADRSGQGRQDRPDRARSAVLAHVPEKWAPVFRSEHAQNRRI